MAMDPFNSWQIALQLLSPEVSQHHVVPCMSSFLIPCIIRHEVRVPHPDLAGIPRFPSFEFALPCICASTCLGITYEDLVWNSTACMLEEEGLNTLLLYPEIQ